MVAGLRRELEVVVVKVVGYRGKVEMVVDSKLIGLPCSCRAPHGVVGVWADVHNHKLVFFVKDLG